MTRVLWRGITPCKCAVAAVRGAGAATQQCQCHEGDDERDALGLVAGCYPKAVRIPVIVRHKELSLTIIAISDL